MDTQAFHRFSRNDVAKMLESGIVAQSSTLELIQGHLLNGTDSTPRQQAVADHIATLLSHRLPAPFTLQKGEPLAVDAYNLPRPTLSVCDGTGSTVLTLQVADNNLSLARLEKAQAFGRHGVPEYWLFSLPERMLVIFRQPYEAGYKEVKRLPVGRMQASPLFSPETRFEVAELMEPLLVRQ
jgi:hypothetical protein